MFIFLLNGATFANAHACNLYLQDEQQSHNVGCTHEKFCQIFSASAKHLYLVLTPALSLGYPQLETLRCLFATKFVRIC